jgi:hypothetical protein
MLGSGASADLQAAAAAVESGTHRAPEPVTLKAPVLPDHANKPKPSIASAETVPTPALVPTAAAVEPPVAAASASARDLRPDEIHDESVGQAASVVALPRRRRASTAGGSNKDVLADWGWGTDSHAAIGADDEDHFAEQAQQNRKRLMIAVGGAFGAILLITVIAFAFSGGKKDKDKDKEKAEAAQQQVQTQEEPKQEPPPQVAPKVDEAKAEPPKTDESEQPKIEELALLHEGAQRERLAVELPPPDPAELAKKEAELKKEEARKAEELAKKEKEEQAKLELAKKEEAKKAELAKKEEARKAELAKKEEAKKEEARKAELAKADAAKKAELAKADAAKKAELAKADAAKKEEARKAEVVRMAELA